MKIPRIPYAKLFPYTIGEDIANSVTHGVGAILAAFMNVQLIYVASTKGEIKDVIAFAIFGTAVFLMMLMSCLYHAIRHVMTRDVFKRLDHSMIFILILGTYTPLVFALNTFFAYVIYAIIAVLAIIGIVLKSIFPGINKIISIIIYITMGWLGILLAKDMAATLNINTLYFIVAGGIAYTLGALFYAFAKFKYSHALWHIFVMLGIFLHYIAICYYLL